MNSKFISLYWLFATWKYELRTTQATKKLENEDMNRTNNVQKQKKNLIRYSAEAPLLDSQQALRNYYTFNWSKKS